MSAPEGTLADAVGLALVDQLRERFQAISREDAFLGAALALSLREADLLAAQIELRHMHMALQGSRA